MTTPRVGRNLLATSLIVSVLTACGGGGGGGSSPTPSPALRRRPHLRRRLPLRRHPRPRHAADAAPVPPPGAGVTFGDTLGVTSTGRLVTFDREDPALDTAIAITGLQSGETVLGIDIRAGGATPGQLYALGSTGRLYTVDTTTGVATQKSTLAADAGDSTDAFTQLSGTEFGVDFNRRRRPPARGQRHRPEPAHRRGQRRDHHRYGLEPRRRQWRGLHQRVRRGLPLDALLHRLDHRRAANHHGSERRCAHGGRPAGRGCQRGRATSRSPPRRRQYRLCGAGGRLERHFLRRSTSPPARPRRPVRSRASTPASWCATPRSHRLRAPAQDPGDLYAITEWEQLVSFNSSAPRKVCTQREFTGQQTGETIVGMDVRPADQALYALGSTGRLYNVDKGARALTLNHAGRAVGDLSDAIHGAHGTDLRLRLQPGQRPGARRERHRAQLPRHAGRRRGDHRRGAQSGGLDRR